MLSTGPCETDSPKDQQSRDGNADLKMFRSPASGFRLSEDRMACAGDRGSTPLADGNASVALG